MANLIGTDPNQIPLNSMLGSMAGQDTSAVHIEGGIIDGTAIGANIPSTASVTSLNTGHLAGNRNKISNGQFYLAQLGTSIVSPVSGATLLDNWVFTNNTTAVVTVTQDTISLGSPPYLNHAMKVTVTTASATSATYYCTLQHKVSGTELADLVGNTFTLSFWVYSSVPGGQSVSFHNPANDRSYVGDYNIVAANNWEKKSITVVGGLRSTDTWLLTPAGYLLVEFSLLSGSNYGTTSGSWVTGSYQKSTNYASNNVATIGNVFSITGVQLEVGSVATPFEQRPYTIERIINNSGGMGATGAKGNPVFYENDITVTGDYTITAGKNAMSAGPITINNSVTVTIPTGSTWTVV